MDLGLANKTVLLTGASRGLGLAAAQTLAREGARVAINSRNVQHLAEAEQQLTALGADVITLPGDVSHPDIPQKLVDATVDAFGGLDLLFTNAGGPPPAKFEEIDDATWGYAIELSLMSHIRLIRAALPHLRQSAAAAVLTVTSISVKQPIPNLVLSNSIRAATVGLTKTLALELGPDGIRFNSILPSFTDTKRVAQLLAERAARQGTTLEEEKQAQSAQSPLGRMGTPQEFGNAAAFLLSPAAAYITGVMLTVDGGTYKGLL
jgi:3-oxoacyl-[acyl-carrier protein] reductase